MSGVIGEGYATTGVNVPIFRMSSLVTFGDTQYAGFYDARGRMVLAKRRHGSDEWETRVTPYSGNVHDVHNCISLGVDGTGLLHVSWDHHNDPLKYCRAVQPGALALTDPLAMTGRESCICYPQFYLLPGGDLLFACRQADATGSEVIMNRYEPASGRWAALPGPALCGEGPRAPYWQIAVDARSSGIHLSWCWAELDGRPGYEPNHDICYARSDDGGRTWLRSDREPYMLPITIRNAEVAVAVPTEANLGNMTSSTVDSRGRPFIAQHWRPKGEATEQLFLVFHDGAAWQVRQAGRRAGPSIDLTREGGFPLSRPLLVLDRQNRAAILTRDAGWGGRAVVTFSLDTDHREWATEALTQEPLGEWEPTADGVLWQRDNILHLFIQRCARHCPPEPVTHEAPPEPIRVLEWRMPSA